MVVRLNAGATGLFKLSRPRTRTEQAMSAVVLDQDNVVGFGDAQHDVEQGGDTESDEGEARALQRLDSAIRGDILRVQAGCRPPAPQDSESDNSEPDGDSAPQSKRRDGGHSIGGRKSSRGGKGGSGGGGPGGGHV